MNSEEVLLTKEAKQTYKFGNKTVSRETVALCIESLIKQAYIDGVPLSKMHIIDDAIRVWFEESNGSICVIFGSWTREPYPLQEATTRLTQLIKRGAVKRDIIIQDNELHDVLTGKIIKQ